MKKKKAYDEKDGRESNGEEDLCLDVAKARMVVVAGVFGADVRRHAAKRVGVCLGGIGGEPLAQLHSVMPATPGQPNPQRHYDEGKDQ